jgi:hypothetical protein
LAEILNRSFPGEICCQHRGKQGNRIEFITVLPAETTYAHLAEHEMTQGKVAAPAPAEAQVSIRLLTAADAEALMCCLYRSYGYTYPNDTLYDAKKLGGLYRSGLLLAAVAVNEGGEIVGYLALTLPSLDAVVAEAGQAMVDPRYRGHHLFEKMKAFLVTEARDRGLHGIFSEAVTIHPFSQMGNLSLGARETGVLLGYWPATVSFKKIDNPVAHRQTVVLFYLKVKEGPENHFYAPPAHEAVLRRICEVNGLARTIRTAPGRIPQGDLPPLSQVKVQVRTEQNDAFLQVSSCGQDLEQVLRFRVRELCLRRLDCIYLDLPLADRATMSLCGQLENLGFFFGGIVPELAGGDIFRLQLLNNLAIDPQETHLASDFGKELLAYVLKAQAAAPEVVFH